MTKENGHEWENTKLKYKDMCKMLKEEFEGRPCWKQVRDWLDIKEINVMQYKENDQTAGGRNPLKNHRTFRWSNGKNAKV